jgi:3-hydroxybutyryl-CoA dehydratase
MSDDFPPFSVTADFELIGRYADLTGDHNPLHVDREFARTTRMGGPIAHGTLSLNLIWQSLDAMLGDDIEGVELAVRFVRPVREGETATSHGSVDAGSPGAWDVWVENGRGERCIEGTVRLPDGRTEPGDTP